MLLHIFAVCQHDEVSYRLRYLYRSTSLKLRCVRNATIRTTTSRQLPADQQQTEALNGTSITHERLTNFTSESLEVNVYSRRRVCGDGGALSDDMDSDDDDDEFNSAPADDAYDDAYM